MNNEELFQDLKQFITATVSQQTADLGQRIDSVEANMATKTDIKHLDKHIDTLDEKLDLVQDAIAEVVTQDRVVTKDVIDDLGTLEKRIGLLERLVVKKMSSR